MARELMVLEDFDNDDVVVANEQPKAKAKNKGGRPAIYAERHWQCIESMIHLHGLSNAEAHRILTQTSKNNNTLLDDAGKQLFADRVPSASYFGKVLKARRDKVAKVAA